MYLRVCECCQANVSSRHLLFLLVHFDSMGCVQAPLCNYPVKNKQDGGQAGALAAVTVTRAVTAAVTAGSDGGQ